MGPPVNILSRIDSLTKEPAFAQAIDSQSLILTREAADAIRFCIHCVELVRIDLASLGLKIRDFPEEDAVWMLPLNQANRVRLKESGTVQSVSGVLPQAVQ